MQKFVYVDTADALQALVAQYQRSPLLVLDTEFVRTRTYYAQLGLIQAFDGTTLALIDPVAIKDLSAFWALLTDSNIMKLLHSGSEDLEVFAHLGQCQPAPLLDSQLAAALAGMGHGLGYAKLVQQLLGVELDKGESRTDWLKRPLSDAQLQYAANDVDYLYQLYPKLCAALEQQGRMAWALEESQRMTEGRLDAPDLPHAYLKVKNAFQLTPMELAVLRALAAWRMAKAIKRDLAVGFVMKDHTLLALAKKQPTSLNELLQSRDLSDHEKRIHAKELVKVIANADKQNLPEPLDVLALKPGYKSAFKLIKNAITAIAEDKQAPIELLGSKKLIHEYLEWIWNQKQGAQPLVLQGWRGSLLAEGLAAIEPQLL
ncbi:ribonuclease D [Shewanella sp. C32]|uniref:Ribonuclease D n=1 Tax=Shewanella electrica TaxID=515560 RepID=A0ABT2FKU2_9GAMM|nr:ribonuclease D [Shewanella electrica]MCH1923741.1 ribonuclease D [Shewanella electrica]MCS4556959.1 ribonuclease D [Shewanella electrica]